LVDGRFAENNKFRYKVSMTKHISGVSLEAPDVNIERGGWGRDFQAKVLGSKVTGRLVFYFEGDRDRRSYAAGVIFDRDDEVPQVPVIVGGDPVRGTVAAVAVKDLILDDEIASRFAGEAIQQYCAA
jgi:hypothetical protein